MLELFEEQAELLKTEPSRLTQITDELLKTAAQQHHQFNKLLPADFIQTLFNHTHPQLIAENNETALKYLLAVNGLRGIMIANFQQFGQNKLYLAILMNYSQSLAKLVEAQRKKQQTEQTQNLKLLARGLLLSQIILKLIQRAHHFVPEYFRFVKISMESAISFLIKTQGEVTIKQYQKISENLENSNFPKAIFNAGFKKTWSRSLLILYVNTLSNQVQRYLKTSGLTNLSISLSISKEILEQFQLFKSTLSEQEQQLTINVHFEEENKENQTLYLQQPIQVRELTPRFYDEEKAVQILKLRRKKQKLTKKIQGDLRKSVLVKQQEQQVREEVRRQKGQRQQKKEMLIIEKQTVEAKKFHRQTKKVKQIQKISKKTEKDAAAKGTPRGFFSKGRK